MQPPPIEPGHPLEQAARRRPRIAFVSLAFVSLGLLLGVVEVLLVRGHRYDWAVKLAFGGLGGYLGGVLKQKLGIKEDDKAEDDGTP